jgi:hypothetical protein
MKQKLCAALFALFVAIAIGSGNVSAALFPVDVQELADGGNRKIVRVYELSPDENPDEIPREAFERGGVRFELTEIVKQETELEDRREHSETVTLETESRELEAVLPLLTPAMDFVSADGYAGTLTLDVSSIAVAEGGTEKRAYTLSTTREYPHLSANDTALIPKTTVERGLTYALESIDWQAQTLETIDYERSPESYRAVATYTVSGVSTRVTGYVTTAEYRGEIVKISPGKTRYTAYFVGSLPVISVQDPQAVDSTPTAEKEPFNAAPLMWATGIVGGLALIGAAWFAAFRRLKGKIRKF